MYMHSHTLYWVYRPFGCGVIVAYMDKEKKTSTLHMMDPSGTCYEFYYCALGKGKQIAKSELEKVDYKSMTCKEALYYVAKTLHKSHEEMKEKKFELEMTWVCPESGYIHQHVPRDLVKEADVKAQKDIEREQLG